MMAMMILITMELKTSMEATRNTYTDPQFHTNWQAMQETEIW